MDYQDAQIAEIYDVANPLGRDGEFYVSLAGARRLRVLDLGCGTGVLCCALAERGHRVTGVDPAGAMLAVSRRKRYADRVEWVETTAQRYRSERRFDLIVMTDHAFQCLLTDEDILATFATIHNHLTAGGRVMFETRNPRVDWAERWAARPPAVHRLRSEEITETTEVTGSRDDVISFQTVYRFSRKTLTTTSTLRFPSRERVENLLGRSGFRICELFGDWDASCFDPADSPEIIVVAQRAFASE